MKPSAPFAVIFKIEAFLKPVERVLRLPAMEQRK